MLGGRVPKIRATQHLFEIVHSDLQVAVGKVIILLSYLPHEQSL